MRSILICNHEIALIGLKVFLVEAGLEIKEIYDKIPNKESLIDVDLLVIYSTENVNIIFEDLKKLQKKLSLPVNIVLFVQDMIGREEILNFINENVRVFLNVGDTKAEMLHAFQSIKFNQSHFSDKACSSQDIVRTRTKPTVKKERRKTGVASLSKRERQVFKMLAEGKTVKDVATDLNLSVKTVECHKSNLMRKLKIHNKIDLTMYALEIGVIQLKNTSGKPQVTAVS